MTNLFVTTEIEDNKFIGVVYNKNTNAQVYKTQKHAVQQEAINEVNMYLRSNSLSKHPTLATHLNNTSQTQPKRCCGR